MYGQMYLFWDGKRVNYVSGSQRVGRDLEEGRRKIITIIFFKQLNCNSFWF